MNLTVWGFNFLDTDEHRWTRIIKILKIAK